MAVLPPEFSTLKLGRKGYEKTAVDEFVQRVLQRLGDERATGGMSSHELAINLFDEARGSAAYDEEQVDTWMREARAQMQQLETNLREEDLPSDREGSIVDMSAPPHYADRFPRVSRAVLGFTVQEVDTAMESLRTDLAAPDSAPSAEQILGMTFTEEPGGYRQIAVAQTLELIAMARRAG